LLVALFAGLVLVTAALADTPAGSTPAATCKALRKTAPELFGPGKTYKNLGACVSAKAQQASGNTKNAAAACKAEQADANFASTHGGKSFVQFYGTSSNGNGHGKGQGNAFGKCVSSKASAKSDSENEGQLNAANQCKAQAADPGFAASHGGKSFSDFYGTNANKRNAFGKCVSTLAKQQS
jgi:hypothetical protein